MQSIADAVRSQRATQIERLGSDRGLLALTGADLDPETVRERIATTDAAVAAVLADWAETGDGEAADSFAEAARTKRDHVQRLVGDDPGGEASDPVAAALAAADSTDERVGAGLVGYTLVADGRYLQAVNLLVNEADEAGADQFRTVRSETAALADDAGDLVADTDAAVGAAVAVVDAAYDAYVADLEALGINPKTVC